MFDCAWIVHYWILLSTWLCMDCAVYCAWLWTRLPMILLQITYVSFRHVWSHAWAHLIMWFCWVLAVDLDMKTCNWTTTTFLILLSVKTLQILHCATTVLFFLIIKMMSWIQNLQILPLLLPTTYWSSSTLDVPTSYSIPKDKAEVVDCLSHQWISAQGCIVEEDMMVPLD